MYMPKTPMLTSRGLITSSASFTQFAPALDAYHENGSFREKEEGGVVISLIKSINGKKTWLGNAISLFKGGSGQCLASVWKTLSKSIGEEI